METINQKGQRILKNFTGNTPDVFQGILCNIKLYYSKISNKYFVELVLSPFEKDSENSEEYEKYINSRLKVEFVYYSEETALYDYLIYSSMVKLGNVIGLISGFVLEHICVYSNENYSEVVSGRCGNFNAVYSLS